MTHYQIGVFVGFIVSFIIVFALALLVRKKRGGCKTEYDERQQIVRGKAFEYAFFAMLIVDALTFLSAVFIPGGLNCFDFALMNVFVGLGVYACYSIWKDAYFGLVACKKSYVILYVGIAAVNLLAGIHNLQVLGLNPDDGFSGGLLNLGCGFLFLAMLITMGIKKLVEKESDS